eukprot:evm.model.scf_3698.1 EVM.evm.TU.scf_3698.1   scf_3698:6248-10667(-)
MMASRERGAWGRGCDLRRGVMVFSALQAVLAGPRLLAAAVAVWAAGMAYLALVPGAVMYGLAGFAGLRATQDKRLVHRWDPKARAAAELCTVIGCVADAVDIAALAYLLSWQGIHGSAPGMVVFVAVQQSFLVGLESCMLLVLWSYHWRLQTLQPVMPMQEPLLVPSIKSADTNTSSSHSHGDVFPITPNPLFSLLETQQAPRASQNPSIGGLWRWGRLQTTDKEWLLGNGQSDSRGEGAATNRELASHKDGSSGMVDIKIMSPQPCGAHRNVAEGLNVASSWEGWLPCRCCERGPGTGAMGRLEGNSHLCIRVES